MNGKVFAAIYHEFAIIAIFIVHRLKILLLASLATHNNHALKVKSRKVSAKRNKFALLGCAISALPLKAG